MQNMVLRRVVLGLVGALVGCGDPPPGQTFYQRKIEPILIQKCAGNTSGCHSTNADDPFAFAAGNLDVTSFANLQKRRDTLQQFGAYPYALLLIKGVGPGVLQMQYGPTQQFIKIDVQHSGGGLIDVGSDAYFTLQSWLENGASENGLRPATPAQTGIGGCSTAIPPAFVAADYVTPATQQSFNQFKQTVQPILVEHGCTAASCHGAPQSDFYITCGDSEDQLAFNFSQAWSFVNDPVDDSQLLRVPLAVAGGGRGHTGGDQFASFEDPELVAIRTWADQAGLLAFAAGDPARQFFADSVQPMLIQRGCAFQACHSAGASNDFKLRSGAPGFFSAVALQKNYDLLRNEFMALEFPDARRGRAGAKTVLFLDQGAAQPSTALELAHRGGAVLESPDSGKRAEPASCPDPAVAFCVLQEWLDRERAALGAQVTAMTPGAQARIVYVERDAGTATAGRLEFDEFHGGADLRVATTTFGANQSINAIDAVADTQSLIGGCGLGASPDVQSPSVAHDGARVVFAARASAAEPLGVFLVDITGAGCQRVTPIERDGNNVAIHNFDPAFAPDGNFIVFASTRGKPGGPGVTRSRLRFLPQSDLWRVSVDNTTVDQGSYEQMTFLSNSEVRPAFMREGRVTMTTEKASQGFYQLAGRRINWDLTDYHPLLAQRKESIYADLTNLAQARPSVGFSSATDIREASNGNFLLIVSDTQASGAPVLPGAGGALAVFNRSLGPFESGRADVGYLPSMRIVGDPDATGRAGATASYRHPFSMPDGTIMVAFAPNAAQANFDIVAVDLRNPANPHRSLFNNGGGKLRMDAVLAYRYPPRALYDNRRQLVFGGSTDRDDPAHAVVHMPDAPMVFTLLTGNLRRGRPVDAFRAARFLAVYSEGNCPPTGCTGAPGTLFEARSLLGTADLADDGSVRVRLPSRSGIVFELQDADRRPLVTMGEEHQLGPGEQISLGVSEKLFDAVCGGCHGSISGKELDVAVTPDALTGASQSLSATAGATAIGN